MCAPISLLTWCHPRGAADGPSWRLPGPEQCPCLVDISYIESNRSWQLVTSYRPCMLIHFNVGQQLIWRITRYSICFWCVDRIFEVWSRKTVHRIPCWNVVSQENVPSRLADVLQTTHNAPNSCFCFTATREFKRSDTAPYSQLRTGEIWMKPNGGRNDVRACLMLFIE